MSRIEGSWDRVGSAGADRRSPAGSRTPPPPSIAEDVGQPPPAPRRPRRRPSSGPSRPPHLPPAAAWPGRTARSGPGSAAASASGRSAPPSEPPRVWATWSDWSAEDVADDLAAVAGVDLAQVHPAVDQVRRSADPARRPARRRRPGPARWRAARRAGPAGPGGRPPRSSAGRCRPGRPGWPSAAGRRCRRWRSWDAPSDRARRTAGTLDLPVPASRSGQAALDLRQASGPGGPASARPAPDAAQAVGPAGGAGASAPRRIRAASTTLSAASSTSVGVPRTTRNSGSAASVARVCAGHSGMFPCFFGGSVSRLLRSSRSTRVISARVSCGAMTAST